ncbi:SLBB domain-containing protein [Candidatus Neomarinimicrobiota bacterium]
MTKYLGLLFVGITVLFNHVLAQNQLFPTVDEIRPTEGEQFLPPYQAAVQGTALENQIIPAEYIVGPGDRFVITILGTDPYMELVTVTPTGELILPKVGSVSVSGLTVDETSQRVKASIMNTFPTYNSDCVLYGIREIRVSLAGAVRSAGFQVVTPLSRVSDLLRISGGVEPTGALNRVELRRVEGATIHLDLVSYYHDGDLSQNPFLREGDQVIVPNGDLTTDLVLIRGLAATPKYYPVRPNETIATLLGRIPIESQADLSSVTIQRHTQSAVEENQVVVTGQFPKVRIYPGDEIYIPRIAIIAVTGEVRKPGNYAFQPGMEASDYIVIAGGVTREGSSKRVLIERKTANEIRGLKTEILGGDAIYVPRSFNSVFLGQLGMIQAALTFLQLYMTYLAATRV